MSNWTQPVCQTCWNTRNPGRVAAVLRIVETEVCCFCGEETASGIYMRVEPGTAPFAQDDD